MHCGQYTVPLEIARQVPSVLESHGYALTPTESSDDLREFLWMGRVESRKAGVGLWIIQGCFDNRKLVPAEDNAVVYVIYPRPWLWSLVRRCLSKQVLLAMEIEQLLESKWGEAIRPTKYMLRNVFSAPTAKE